MKSFFLFFTFCSLSASAAAQNFSAKYKITREIKMTTDNTSLIQDLPLEGYFFRKIQKVISYSKPLYLKSYPLGYIADGTRSYSLFMDTIQQIFYCDLDSFILRKHYSMTGLNEHGINISNFFETGVHNWKLYDESRLILGLKCLKATLNGPDGNIACEIWYAQDIPMQTGLYNLLDLPGLIVEGDYFSIHERFSLQTYSFEEEIPDEVFWPKEFNETFTQRAKLVSRKKLPSVLPEKN